MNNVHVIGIGQGKADLTLTHLDLIGQADLLIGGTRHLAMFPNCHETFAIRTDLSAVVQKIQDEMHEKRIVVLASGDPLFYGIGTTLACGPGKAGNIGDIGCKLGQQCAVWQVLSRRNHTGFNHARVTTKIMPSLGHIGTTQI